ncbi:MAG: DUF58 domain-containing protein [Candidatus Nitronauta litoralis]|uniref:DUF58 domain-containing protein n=1 Tax=Candidatus Nitronauta litoralis TaxID=2705533 RepID=A0A7T0BYY8_9BACT|nr:MAG: DUF58 domain-containing protein [Candidatus Nitronauta litoralis]
MTSTPIEGPKETSPSPELKKNSKPVFTLTLANRTLQLTREGGGFVVLVLGIGLGAINTGNNLLYLILAMCCSLIAVSGILSETILKNISVSATSPRSIYAEDPTSLFLTISNNKKIFPSYSIQFDAPAEFKGRFALESPLYVLHLPAGSTIQKSVRLVAFHRGKQTLNAIRISTGFPFGFFIKSKIIPLNLEVIAYPAIYQIELPEPSEIATDGEGLIKQRGDDLLALREFQTGDPLDNVHWKSSAKTGTLRVKEFAAGGRNSFTIVLNLEAPKTDNVLTRQDVEEKIKESASLIFHLIQRGDEVSLKTQNFESEFGNSPQHLEALMRYLALFETASSPETIQT